MSCCGGGGPKKPAAASCCGGGAGRPPPGGQQSSRLPQSSSRLPQAASRLPQTSTSRSGIPQSRVPLPNVAGSRIQPPPGSYGAFLAAQSRPCGSTGLPSKPCGSTGLPSRPCGSTGLPSRPCGSTGLPSRPCGSTGLPSRPCGSTGVPSRTGIGGAASSSRTGIGGAAPLSRIGVSSAAPSSRLGVSGAGLPGRSGISAAGSGLRTGDAGAAPSLRLGVSGGVPASRLGVGGTTPSARSGASGARPTSRSGDVGAASSLRQSSSSSIQRGGIPSKTRTVNTTTVTGTDGRTKKTTTVTETSRTLRPPSQQSVASRKTSADVPEKSKGITSRPSRSKIATSKLPSKQGPGVTYGPAPRPEDYSSPVTAIAEEPDILAQSSLDKLVANDLLEKSILSPGVPVQAQRTKTEDAVAPVVETSEGLVQATHQTSLQKTVERVGGSEIVKKNLTTIEADETGQAVKYVMNLQNMQSSGFQPPTEEGLPHETISTVTTVTTGPNVTVTSRTAVYETKTDPPHADEDGVCPAKISFLIDEESKDVDKINHLQPPELKASPTTNFPLKKKLQKMKFSSDSVRDLEKSIVYPPVSADEAQEETQPEVLAAIMHSEERGLNMDSVPTNVYNYLFPDAKDDLLMKINPVAPGVLQNVVVPETVPSEIHVKGVTPELECAAVEATECGRKRPADNIFTESVIKAGVQPEINNTAVKGKTREKAIRKQPYIVLASIKPPWEVEDIQPIINLVGAEPLKAMTTEDSFEIPAYHHEYENVLEYHLIPEPPQHVSRVQLRGSQSPSWFPGYYMALPENIKVLHSPTDVLPAAWQAVQPDVFSDDSFLIVG